MAEEPGIVKSLFLGTILEERLFPFPEPQAGQREMLRLVLDSVGRFLASREVKLREYDLAAEQPDDYLEALRELGLFGLIIPEEFGGIGLSNTSYSRVLQEISRYDAATSVTVGAHSSIGLKGLLLFGTAAQKERYLPALASGELIAAFCLTEPGSGSDAASIRTTAEKQPDGSWVLNGEKIWISNGSFAGFFTVFARTEGDEGKLSAFIVEREWAGVSAGPKEDKLGIRASATTSVRFENVRVPPENLLGEEGKGFKIAMSILNNGRTGLGGGAVGGMKRCLALAARQAGERRQFGQPIATFALVKKKIAQMSVNCFAAESAVALVGHLIDSGMEDYSVEAAISKIYSSEALWHAANEALQIAGGNGYMREFPYERILRDSRINMIFEGTNEILRLYVALSGMKDVGDYLKGVGRSASSFFNDPIKGFGVLSSYATKKVSQLTSVGRDRIERVPPELADLAKVYEYYTLWLSRGAESVLRAYDKDIIGKQFISERFANVAVDLFVGLCILSRVSTLIAQSGAEKNKPALHIARIFTEQAKRRMNASLRYLEGFEDAWMESLAEEMVRAGGYPWDTV